MCFYKFGENNLKVKKIKILDNGENMFYNKCMLQLLWKVSKMNEILEQSLLYDFYGELLTKHQKEIYEQFVLEDLSL